MRDGQTRPDGERWGDLISAERKAELDAFITRWEAQPDGDDRRPPLAGVRLTGADVFWLAARFRSELSPLHLEQANLSLADLRDADLTSAHLEGAGLVSARLHGADLQGCFLQDAALGGAELIGAYLRGAHLERAVLPGADLTRADLCGADLRHADLSGARLDGANLTGAHLEYANCTAATFDRASRLNHAHLNGVVLDQVVFDNTNLAVLDWAEVQTLGDDKQARAGGTNPTEAYRAAARANRALSVALRGQGLARESAHFHYRSELMDRKALFHLGWADLRAGRPLRALWAYVRWLASWALGTFAGYGDYIGRLFLTYAGVVLLFALAMFVVAADHSPAGLGDALVLSLTSFHGRGLTPPNLHNDSLLALGAVEAVFGLLIEGLLIAAFTRRIMGS